MRLNRLLAGLAVPCLLLLTLSAPVGAQDNDAATDPAGQKEAPAPSAPSPATEPAASGGAGDRQAPFGTAPTPQDYEASEQIREDLPVSFPVDI